LTQVRDQAAQRPLAQDLAPAELDALLAQMGEPRYRARQVFHWLHGRMATRWEQMSDLPAGLRARLAERLDADAGEVVADQRSTDGTRKLLIRLRDGERIETVGIPARDGRLTVCVSTQAGCALACGFCATGEMGLTRNLTPGEIVAQVYRFATPHARPEERGVTNVVYMGMGEPLHNYAATVASVRLLAEPVGMGMSERRITVSTSGLVPQIRRLAKERLDVRLAVSLHAPNDAVREAIMPIARRWPLRELLAAARDFAGATDRRVSFEYVMLAGVNDRPEHAAELARTLRGALPKPLLHVNLIPYNPTAAVFTGSSPAAIDRFAAVLHEQGVRVTVRASRGRDIAAACGQLKTDNGRT
jgi:23S rRNA (adenine2503-C2)-methyltransferase